MTSSEKALFAKVMDKAGLKQEVYSITMETFRELKETTSKLAEKFQKQGRQINPRVVFEFTDRSDFEFELRFGGDVLVFFMHSNVFEFPRDHEVMKTRYVRDDISRSYCGIIHIFNFLSDSFTYNRTNDVGYLIGRLFVNRENHYFIEGKKEIGLLYDTFPTAVLNARVLSSIVESAIHYTIGFDLLTPPFDSMKEVSVEEIRTVLDNMKIRTGKRLGFRFQADQPEE